MIIQLQFDDGRVYTVTPDQLVSALRAHLEELPQTAAVPARCPLCQYGRIGDGYCTCALGRDLRRIEAPTFNPVGGMDGGDDALA
jgi:hypothetical protein